MTYSIITAMTYTGITSMAYAVITAMTYTVITPMTCTVITAIAYTVITSMTYATILDTRTTNGGTIPIIITMRDNINEQYVVYIVNYVITCSNTRFIGGE